MSNKSFYFYIGTMFKLSNLCCEHVNMYHFCLNSYNGFQLCSIMQYNNVLQRTIQSIAY